MKATEREREREEEKLRGKDRGRYIEREAREKEPRETYFHRCV